MSTDDVRVGRTPDGTPEPLLNFRKINSMAKQKIDSRPPDRKTVWPEREFAYPAPTLHIQQTVGDRNSNSTYPRATLDHISRPNRNLATTKLAYPTPLASRFDSVRSAAGGIDLQIDSNLSCLPWTYPGHTHLVCTGDDIKLDQDKPAYLDRIHHTSSTGRPSNRSSNRPCPSSLPYTVQHTAAHDRASRLDDSNKPNSTKSNSTTLHRPSGDDTSKYPQPLQVSRNPENPIGEIEAKDGLPSADRNNKATLLLTGPFRHS
ncbi:hypothetical protein ACKAV7_003736 [Fusarium commune]